ncbi:porin [Telmatospirillum sp.]|uniref:porin n=1 Tax=Telmatospirillum sp. TaxID=2079197 RepID=UPI00284710EC|nr:porin [Telmatospirillum sp.]MDR3440986.1 porin [Telmatospirillum sp.]
MEAFRQFGESPIPAALLMGMMLLAASETAAHAADSAGAISESPLQKAMIDILDGARPGELSAGGITVYGVVDVDLSYQSHGAPPSPYMNGQYLVGKNSGKSRFDFSNNALGQSIIGIKTEQPLQDLFGIKELEGWSLIGDVASGFDPAFASIQDACKSLIRANGTGNVPGTKANADSSRCGQFFNGEAWGGLKSATFGELRFGRQNSLMFDDFAVYDPQKLSYANSLFGLSGTYAGGFGDTEDKHWNNSLKYKIGVGPGRIAAQYRFEGAGQGGTAYAFDAGLTGWGPLNGFSIDAVWGQFKDGIAVSSLTNSATKANGSCQYFGVTLSNCTSLDILNATVSDNTAWAVMTKYNLASIGAPTTTVMGGYESITYSNPSDKLAAGYKTIGDYNLNFTSTTFSTYTTDKRVNVFWAGARWDITPKLTAAGAWYYFDQNSYVRAGAACTNPGSGTATQSQCKGDMNWLSATLDYQVTKRLDVYTGVSHNIETGGLTNGYTHTSTTGVTTGARFRF